MVARVQADIKRSDLAYVREAMAYQLTKQIWSYEDSDTLEVDIENPSSWWQHLKRDHFPQWFIKRWPVKFNKTVVDIKKMILFPLYDEFPDEMGIGVRQVLLRGTRSLYEG